MENTKKENGFDKITPKPAEFINKISLEDLQARLRASGVDFADKIDKYPIQIKPAIEHYGIEELKDVVLLGIYIIKAFVLTNTNVLARWLAVITAIPNAIVGVSQVPLEIADLDETELNELIDYVKSLIPEITNEYAIKLIEHSIKVAWGIYNIVNLINEFRNHPSEKNQETKND